MAPAAVRRSSRLTGRDSNGREYLANHIGWSREELEAWMTSPSVRPHLQLWYHICVGSHKRFNDAVEWINTGEKGYFYNRDDLEDDLLLMCLGEGDGDDEDAAYMDESAKTGNWITQELWARTVWRIVQGNRGPGQAFEKHTFHHPAACYGFVIDPICLAFHSIAFRGRASVYEQLINATMQTRDLGKHDDGVEKQTPGKEDDDATSTTTIFTHGSSTAISEHTSDADFSESIVCTTPATERSTSARNTSSNDIDTTALQRWAEDVSSCTEDHGIAGIDSMQLHLVDENGLPITGYRRAATGIAPTLNVLRTEVTGEAMVGVQEARSLAQGAIWQATDTKM